MKAIKNIRLRDYDYSSNGYYFVTICTNYKKPYFKEASMKKIVVAEDFDRAQSSVLARLQERFTGLDIDYFTFMPTHAHIILILENSRYPLNRIIQAFKSISTLRAKHRAIGRSALGGSFATTGWRTSLAAQLLRTCNKK